MRGKILSVHVTNTYTDSGGFYGLERRIYVKAFVEKDEYDALFYKLNYVFEYRKYGYTFRGGGAIATGLTKFGPDRVEIEAQEVLRLNCDGYEGGKETIALYVEGRELDRVELELPRPEHCVELYKKMKGKKYVEEITIEPGAEESGQAGGSDEA